MYTDRLSQKCDLHNFLQELVSQKKFATIFKKALIYAIFENIISIVIGHQPFNGVQLQPLINYLYSPHRSPPVPLSGYLTFYIKSNFSIILLTININCLYDEKGLIISNVSKIIYDNYCLFVEKRLKIPTAPVRVPENNV